MRDRSAVLIVSASAGTGHARAGEALREAFAAEGQTAEHVDVLQLGASWVRAVYGAGFEILASRAPTVWRGVYALADGRRGDPARWGPVAARVLFRHFRRLLRSRPWSCCVCTHFLPAQLAAGRPGLPPFAQVMTDYALHRYWVQRRVRRHFVPGAEVATELAKRLPGTRVVASGIPVAAAFAQEVSWRSARAKLGLDPGRPVALVMGGGLGVGVERSVRAALGARVPEMQVIAVCGRNATAEDRLNRLGVEPARLRVHGYIESVPTAIAAADVVVTKPGGLTISETLAVGRPMILTRPIPGHEALNLMHVVHGGAAVDAAEADALASALERFFREPALRLAMSAAARSMGRPDAATAIVREIRRAAALQAA